MEVLSILIQADCASLSVTGIDMVCTDPPYGATSLKWDKAPVDVLDIVESTVRNLDNINVVTTADMRYAALLINKHPSLFSHDLVWSKTIGSGQLNIKKRPLRTHEHVLVFSYGKVPYNRLFSEGEPYSITRNIKGEQCYRKQRENEYKNEGKRDMKTVFCLPNPRIKGGHPTQKPVALFQKMCDMYCKAEGVVFDPFAGSGTILDVVGHTTIGVERDGEYYKLARGSREDRICEATPERIAYFKQFIPNIEDYRYTIFSSKDTKAIL